jgi:hypothetical protein
MTSAVSAAWKITSSRVTPEQMSYWLNNEKSRACACAYLKAYGRLQSEAALGVSPRGTVAAKES